MTLNEKIMELYQQKKDCWERIEAAKRVGGAYEFKVVDEQMGISERIAQEYTRLLYGNTFVQKLRLGVAPGVRDILKKRKFWLYFNRDMREDYNKEINDMAEFVPFANRYAFNKRKTNRNLFAYLGAYSLLSLGFAAISGTPFLIGAREAALLSAPLLMCAYLHKRYIRKGSTAIELDGLVEDLDNLLRTPGNFPKYGYTSMFGPPSMDERIEKYMRG